MTTQILFGPKLRRQVSQLPAGAAVGAAAFAFFVRHETTGTMGRILTRITGRAASIDSSVPAVVERIQRLNRLETVVYSMDTVVADSLSPATPSGAPGDRVPLVVHGKSIAGIDLAQLKPKTCASTRMGMASRLRCRRAALLDQAGRPAHASSCALNRDAGSDEPDPGARDPRQGAGPTAASRARDGILDAARRNAHATVTALLYSLGFEQVDVK